MAILTIALFLVLFLVIPVAVLYRDFRSGRADPAYREIPVKIIGIPGDKFVDHGAVSDLRRLIRLDVPGLLGQVTETLERLGVEASPSTT